MSLRVSDVAQTGRAFFRLVHAAVAVDGDPDAGRWLREFLDPWFSAEPPGPADLHVNVAASAELHAELSARQRRVSTQPVPCFQLDSELVSHPGWSEPDGSTVVADTDYGCFYRVSGREVQVVIRPRDRLARIGLLRVVRELATLRTLAQPGMLDLHAAALVFRGRAVLLVGEKNSGKTTLLAHALSSGRAALLANDRVIIDCGSRQAYAVPTVVAIREGTEQRFPALGRRLPRRAALLHAGELDSPEAVAAATGTRLVLSPAQFARQLGARSVPCAPVGVLLFPRIAPHMPPWSVRAVARDEGAAPVREGRYASRSGERGRSVFAAIAGQPCGTGDQGALAAFASAVPMVRCVLGPDAYRDDAGVWLRALPMCDGAESP